MIDAKKIEDAVDGITSGYTASAIYQRLDPEEIELEKVVVEIYAYEDELTMTIQYVYGEEKYTFFIDDWIWMYPSPTYDSLYYVVLSLPPRILKRLLLLNPEIILAYRNTILSDDTYVSIVHDPSNDIYTSIWKDEKGLHISTSYRIAKVPPSIYPLAIQTGMSVMEEYPTLFNRNRRELQRDISIIT